MEKNIQNILDTNGNITKTKVFSIQELNEKIVSTSILKSTKNVRWQTSHSSCLVLDDIIFIENGVTKQEKWKLYPAWDNSGKRGKYRIIENIKVSNLGRVKINDIIAEQCDKNNQIGYLQLKNYPSLGMVWNLVATTWLEKPRCNSKSALHVHHISNNGYDNSCENLIWLDKSTHGKINHKTRI